MPERIIRRYITSAQPLTTEEHGTRLPTQAGEPQPTETDSLAQKYAPHTFAELLGQPHVVNSLPILLHRGVKRSFLFTGPSGTGKTTTGRLIAKDLDCGYMDYKEVDGTMCGGIDDMKKNIECMSYKPWKRGGKKVLFIDECASLSSAAWQSLLKPIERPPLFGVYVLSTMLLGKVPPEIQNRCACYDFRLVKTDLIRSLLERVVRAERIEMEPDAIYYLAHRARGVPRQSLTFLDQVRHLRTLEQVKAILLPPRMRLT